MAYTKLANSILTSTVWMESDQTRIVWLTLLAMADKNGEVQASIPGLANVARVSVQACEEAIRIFMSPDPYSRTKVEDGRRLEEIDGGWLIINHEKYRDLCSDTDRKQKAALRQQRRRARLKGGEGVSRNVTLVTHAGVTGCDKSHQNPQADTDTDTDTEENNTSQSTGDSTCNDSKKRNRKSYTVDFEEFWSAYPLRAGKMAAFKAWRQAIKDELPERIIARARAFAESEKGRGAYCPHAATWLNRHSWEDDDATWNPSGRTPDVLESHTPPKPIARGESWI